MKQMLMGGDTPYLCEEIISEILKRLPVKSLIRFQSVTKQWKNLIKSPPFIADHLHYSTHHNRSSLILRKQNQNRGCEPLHLSLINHEMHVREIQNPPLIGSSCVRIIGSCNGLLCAAINESMYCCRVLCSFFVLWNPTTSEIRHIPRTRMHPLFMWDCHGFGFSAIVNDYKIVQIYSGNKAIEAVEVYSLNKPSWKEIELGPLKRVGLTGDSITANGCIFWYGVGDWATDDNYLIVSFDIAMEEFTLILGPPLSKRKSILTVYDDELTILHHSNIGDSPHLYFLIDLWVLDVDGWSWTKKFTSNPYPSTLESLVTIWGDEIVVGCVGHPRLIINESDGRMEIDYSSLGQYLINIITNKGNMVFIPGCRYGYIFNHVESLVSVGNI